MECEAIKKRSWTLLFAGQGRSKKYTKKERRETRLGFEGLRPLFGGAFATTLVQQVQEGEFLIGERQVYQHANEYNAQRTQASAMKC